MHIIHEGQKDYKCKLCQFYISHEGPKDHKFVQPMSQEGIQSIEFDQKTEKEHRHTVPEGQKDYKCEICGKSFLEGRYLKRHILRVHEDHKDCKSLLSQIGSRSLRSKPWFGDDFKRHILTFQEGLKDRKSVQPKTQKCIEINQKTGRNVTEVHEEKKDHKCEICGNSFFNRSSLKRHIHKIHEGQKDIKNNQKTRKNINTKVKPHYSKKFLELFERSICSSQDVANSNSDTTKKTTNEKLFTEIAPTLPISDSEVEETPTSTTDDFVNGESSKSF